MFSGRYEHTIDAKGRTSLPSRFRELLAARGDTRLKITSGLDGCLDAFAIEEWGLLEEAVAAQPQFEQRIVDFRRVYLSGAVDCDLDKLGRVLVPAHLRKHGELQREVLWVGMGKKLELWDRAAFEATRTRILEDPDRRTRMLEGIADLRL